MQMPSLRGPHSLQILRSLFTGAVILVPEVGAEALWIFCDPLPCAFVGTGESADQPGFSKEDLITLPLTQTSGPCPTPGKPPEEGHTASKTYKVHRYSPLRGILARTKIPCYASLVLHKSAYQRNCD